MKRSFEEKEKKITQSQEPLKTLMTGYTSTFLYVVFYNSIFVYTISSFMFNITFTTS